MRLAPNEAEGFGREHERHRKGAARNVLTVGAMAGVNHLRRLGDLVPERTALATTSLWKLHRATLSSAAYPILGQIARRAISPASGHWRHSSPGLPAAEAP
jgi:hypothetical protein